MGRLETRGVAIAWKRRGRAARKFRPAVSGPRAGRLGGRNATKRPNGQANDG